MDGSPPRHSLGSLVADEPARLPPKCCPFCLAETLVTSWDSVTRCTRYECCSCFELFGRLTRDEVGEEVAAGEVVDFHSYRVARASRVQD